ncbi:MAG: hypothetical protein SFU85_13000 [Candidatus Methylacidiphilales bacterium]|nr:hypothetical protein [Candidatus Methylacidiphilales bacterium]
MARNRVRSTNTLQVTRLWKLLALGILVTIFGLVFVFLQIRIINTAEEIKKLESSLEDVKRKNQGLMVQIQHGKSPAALQKQIVLFRLGMVDINNPNIKVYDAPVPARNADTMMARTPRRP